MCSHQTPHNRIFTSSADFPQHATHTFPDVNLDHTVGFLVADARGRVVGKVECPMYGRAEDVPDALAVRSGFLSRRRRLVPAETIVEIDDRSRVIGLAVEREAIRSFL
jgi:hypothetical protein